MNYFLSAITGISVGSESNSFLPNFFIAAFLASIFAYFSYRFKFLKLSGTIAASILGIIIFSLGSWKWIIPIFIFFFFSSVLSKFREKKNNSLDTFFEKAGQRDYMQVISNGGFAGLLVILNYFYPSELFYYAYVSSLASVCADTWATEIGTFSKTKTYNILNFKEVKQGVSGGVSLIGFLAALSGALIVALASLYWIEANSLIFILLILLAGFAGSTIDSILGSTIQARYVCDECGQITERKIHCKKSTKKVKGFSWMNNDIVNLCSGISGAATGFFLTDLIL